MAKIFFIKEKLLILFEYEKKIFGQIGNIKYTDGENIFDIDYLISIKNNISNNYGTIFSINNIFKDEEDYNNFCQNIYNNLNQDNLFEYKISDELILNILNFKRYKEKNYYFSDSNNKQIESRNIKNINDNKEIIQNIQINKNNEPKNSIYENSYLYNSNLFKLKKNKIKYIIIFLLLINFH